MMNSRSTFVALNAAGGASVLLSYWIGLQGPDEVVQGLWGGVPESLRPLYTVNMFCAAAGYFPFTALFLLHGQSRFSRLNLLYALILIPSALWLPLTASMIETPGPGWWLAIRAVLFAVGIGSLGLFFELARLRDRVGTAFRVAAFAGLAAFTLQTLVLDALVWPYYFEV